MADTAELLKARFAAITDDFNTDVTGKRNTIDVDEDELPVVIAFDGDVEVDQARQKPHARPGATVLATLLLEALLAVQAKPEDVGPLLSTLELAFFNAVMLDAELLDMSWNGAGVRYRGSESDLGIGRQLQGQKKIMFAIDFALKPGAA